MAYRSYFRSVINDNFKILTWVLILFTAITPNFIFINTANANTDLNGWTITDRVMDGATRVYNGAKTTVINGANVAKSSVAKITPNSSQVAKAIGRTGAVLAVTTAIEALIGSVDYVMDPANSRVIYYEPLDPNFEYRYKNNEIFSNIGIEYVYTTTEAKSAFRQFFDSIDRQDYPIGTCQLLTSPHQIRCPWGFPNGATDRILNFGGTLNPAYDPTAQQQEKYLPYTAIADEIIGEAEGGDTRAGGYVGDVADWELENTPSVAQDVANQFDANAQTQTAEGANEATGQEKPNTANPDVTDISLEFPAFCGWAPQVCEAANVVINFPNRLQNWWNTATSSISDAWTYAKNWLNNEDYNDIENSEVPIEQNTIIFDDSQRFNFGNVCPMPEQFSITFFGASQDLEFSYQPLCDFMTMIKPFVIAGSYLIGAYIVMGLSRGSGD